jgi:hypothetical protein
LNPAWTFDREEFEIVEAGTAAEEALLAWLLWDLSLGNSISTPGIKFLEDGCRQWVAPQ